MAAETQTAGESHRDSHSLMGSPKKERPHATKELETAEQSDKHNLNFPGLEKVEGLRAWLGKATDDRPLF